jgi:hypothetical protein
MAGPRGSDVIFQFLVEIGAQPMRDIILWMAGVPIIAIVALHVFGLLR